MFGLFGNSRDKAAMRALYETALAAARQPALYTSMGVPDTVEGRFEALAIHLVPVLERLARFDEPEPRLAKLLTEHFVEDMDDAMRAYGVGDLTVPKKVKKAAAALFDRHRAYRPAITATDPTQAWRDALGAEFEPLRGREGVDFSRLARHAQRIAPHLAAQSDHQLSTGQVTFPTALET